MTGQTERQDEITTLANNLLQSVGFRVNSYKVLQKLWAGYGNICHVDATPITLSLTVDSNQQSFILKHVTPPSGSSSASSKDEGHLRKLISYQVEQYFYTFLAPSMPPEISLARTIGSINERAPSGNQTIALLLADLRQSFPVPGEKRGSLDEKQVHAALKWLASFHGFWWTRTEEIRKATLRLPPLEEVRVSEENEDEKRGGGGVWLNGGYTYLATRRKEYESLMIDQSSEWSTRLCEPLIGKDESIAELVAKLLTPSRSESATTPITEYETLIHGDVKSENLFASSSGDEVAFYDFQYVGLGLGVSDLAKLFTCSVPLNLLTDHDIDELEGQAIDIGKGEKKLLEYYQRIIESASGKKYPWAVLNMHWNTALVDWLRFQASWGFWGNTEWLEARVRHILDNEEWMDWILEKTWT